MFCSLLHIFWYLCWLRNFSPNNESQKFSNKTAITHNFDFFSTFLSLTKTNICLFLDDEEGEEEEGEDEAEGEEGE